MATGSAGREPAKGSKSTPAKKPAASALRGALAQRLAASVLPGDGAFTAEGLDAAAGFLLDAAAARRAGHPAIAIESVSGTGADRFMRVAVINDDMPFLVDSIAATVTAQGLGINRLVHPVVAVRRSPDGVIEGLPEGASASGEKRESMVYLETDRADAKSRRALHSALADTLADVRAAVNDWPRMQAAMEEDADGLGDAEGAALLRWLKDGMLTQLGHVTRHRDGSQSQALGICRKGAQPLLGEASFRRAFEWFGTARKGARVPLVIKSNRISTVHRHVPLDLFIVPIYDAGKVAALSIHAGVWTSAALAAAPTQVPRMRAQLSAITSRFGFDPAGHAGKALVHAMTSLPHDLLIGFEDADLERVATTMMSLIDRPRPRLSLVTAPLERHLFAFVWLPRDAMSTATRLQVQAMLTQAADGPVLDWSLEIEGGNLALLQFVIDIREGAAIPDETALDAQLKAILRGWSDAVEAELATHEDAGRAAAIAARYADAFPLAYRATHGAGEAANDISRLRHLAADAGEAGPRRGVRLYSLAGDEAGELRLKLYQRSGAIALSDAVPALENFGFRVIEDVPTTLEQRGEYLGAIHDFRLALPAGSESAAVLSHAPVIESALANVLNGAGEDDGFNRLIAGLRLSAREANWLRAWYRYLRQAGLNFGIPTVVDALHNAPAVTLAVLDLFRALHDPAFSGDRTKAADAAQEAIKAGLSKFSAINDDRLLRAYRALVLAMLRTNAFAP
ncbi:MAG: glutamate dehydrogenase, partial [Novosphingobium sp.]